MDLLISAHILITGTTPVLSFTRTLSTFRLAAQIKANVSPKKKQAMTLRFGLRMLLFSNLVSINRLICHGCSCSPLVFSVKKDHSIVRSRLARSASIRTAACLNEVELRENEKNKDAQEVSRRISSHSRNKDYLRSQAFAKQLAELCYLAGLHPDVLIS